jgi:hypothetical protein
MPTTITRTIGVGKDYASISAWLAGANSTYPSGLVAADVIWKGVLYKEGPGTNNEWSITSGNSITTICDATRYLWLTAAPGASFTDNANKLTNSLRYNNANGVSVLSAVSGSIGVFATDTVSNNQKLVITGIQFKGSGTAYFSYFPNGSITLDSCIIEYSNVCTYGGFSAVDSLIFSTSANIVCNQWSSALSSIRNCTIIGTGSSAVAILINNYAPVGLILKNNAIFGFSAIRTDANNKLDTTNSTNNVTDLASFGWTATGNLVSKVYANQFQSITGGSEDFRVKTGADLINAGVRDQTYTNDLDIVGSARSLTTPTVGAWEFASPAYEARITWAEAQYQASGAPTTPTDYSSPMSRGIFRGIERGVA